LKLTLYTYLYNFIFHASLNKFKKQGSIFLFGGATGQQPPPTNGYVPAAEYSQHS